MYDTVASISCIIAADCSRGTLCKEAPFSDSDIMILGKKVCQQHWNWSYTQTSCRPIIWLPSSCYFRERLTSLFIARAHKKLNISYFIEHLGVQLFYTSLTLNVSLYCIMSTVSLYDLHYEY